MPDGFFNNMPTYQPIIHYIFQKYSVELNNDLWMNIMNDSDDKKIEFENNSSEYGYWSGCFKSGGWLWLRYSTSKQKIKSSKSGKDSNNKN